MGLAREEGLPLHRQISAVLRARILSGHYPKDAIIPGETALMEAYAVSRATVRRALQTLESEGLVERRQGKATRVIHQPIKLLREPFEQHVNRIEREAEFTRVEIVEFGFQEVPAEVQSLLGLSDRAEVLRIVRVRFIGDTPLRYIVNHVPAAIGRRFDRALFLHATLIRVLEDLGHHVTRFEDEISATLADPDAARALEVDIGAPLLLVSRTMQDASGHPVAHQWTYFPAHRGKLRTVIDSGA